MNDCTNTTPHITLPDDNPPLPTVELSISRNFFNKPPKTMKKANYKHFDNACFTLMQLVEHIEQGFPICVAKLNGTRNEANFVSSQVIFVDVDNGSIEDMLAHPFVQAYAAYLYTTPSHTDENPRCRIVFILDCVVEDASIYKTSVVRVQNTLEVVEPDTSTKSAVNIFYGSKNAKFVVPGKLLPLSVLDNLLDIETKKPKQQSSKKQPTRQVGVGETSVDSVYKNWLNEVAGRVADALGATEIYRGGWSNKVQCPCGQHTHDDADPSAGWNFPGQFLHCFKTGNNYNTLQTASFLGLDVSVSGSYPCLHHSTRNFFMWDKSLHNYLRLLDAIILNGYHSNWYSEQELLKAITDRNGNQIMHKNTLRKTLLAFLRSDEWEAFERGDLSAALDAVARRNTQMGIDHKKDTPFGILTTLFRAILFVKKPFKPIRPPKRKSKQGRPTHYYFIPTEQQIAEMFGFEIEWRRWYAWDDLQSPKAYRLAHLKEQIGNNPGQFPMDKLSKDRGVSRSQFRRDIKSDSSIIVTAVWKSLGKLTEPHKIPKAGEPNSYIGYRRLMVIGKEWKFPYIREVAYDLLAQYKGEVETVQQQCNHFALVDEALAIEPASTTAEPQENNSKAA